jgi:hypothetical protein
MIGPISKVTLVLSLSDTRSEKKQRDTFDTTNKTYILSIVIIKRHLHKRTHKILSIVIINRHLHKRTHKMLLQRKRYPFSLQLGTKHWLNVV